MIGPLSDIVNVWRTTYSEVSKGTRSPTEASIGPYQCRVYTAKGYFFSDARGPETALTVKIIGPTGTLVAGDRIEHSPSGKNYILRRVWDVMGASSPHHAEGELEEKRE